MAFLHKELAAGRWFELSLAEQMGNIGSEVSRAGRWQGKDEKLFWGAVWRALDLFDLTMADLRWRGRLREIARAREVFCDAVYGGKAYGTTFQNLQPYFDFFALAHRTSMNLEDIVKTWKPNEAPEFRGFRCGVCQSVLGEEAWHHKLDSPEYLITVHLCDNCQKASTIEEGEYKAFSCDKCGAEVLEAYHIWEKEGKRLVETHLCRSCGEDMYGK